MRHLHGSFEIKYNKTALEWEEEDPNAVTRSHRHHIVRHSRQNTSKARDIKKRRINSHHTPGFICMGITSLEKVRIRQSLLPSTPFPELPTRSSGLSVPFVNTPIVYRHTSDEKGDHDQGLERLGDDGTT